MVAFEDTRMGGLPGVGAVVSGAAVVFGALHAVSVVAAINPVMMSELIKKICFICPPKTVAHYLF